MTKPHPAAPTEVHHAHARRHPALKAHEDLTLGQRAADHMRGAMGSWPFVFAFLAFMGLWAIANSVLYLGGNAGKHGFDPYPFILLNLMLSMVAGLQGAILLIASKRQDEIASTLAHHDYETNLEAKAVIDAVHELTVKIAHATKALEDAADDLKAAE